jgi:ATP-dependent RNA helicase DDX51/DBP6
MFQVGRYDPREDDHQKKKRRRSSSDKKNKRDKQKENAEEEAPAIRVIAPETDGAVSSERKLNTKLNEEAFDDLDITEEDFTKNADVQEDSAEKEEDEKEEEPFDPTDEIQRALHMSKQPIEEAAKAWGLADFLVQNLKDFPNFFPIQSLVIPDVIVAERHAHVLRARDICVAAPTGSGKTLAFCLPVLNALANRKIRRLRALVVLPSRDLAKQVHSVFEHFKEGSDLKIGLAIGQSDFHAEQEDLQVEDHNVDLKFALNPGSFPLAVRAMEEQICSSSGGDKPYTSPRGGTSAVDVLVCTPGRLVDHLDNTPGFTLQHLRFLVIDEADRLLSQPYHGWIARVLESAGNTSNTKPLMEGDMSLDVSPDGLSNVIDPVTWRESYNNCFARPLQLRKLLYSATLTRDPQKLASLQLVNPKFFDAHHLTSKKRKNSGNRNSLYSMPELLQEYTVECTAEQKPLVLLALLLERVNNSKNMDVTKMIVVIFTSSLESTHRLARLLQLLWVAGSYGDHMPMEFSSALNQSQRSALMKQCTDDSSRIHIIVCSDGMSRGMDLPSVATVINYDVPGFAKTYVHRCGRTARAGKSGEAITLLKGSGQVGQFAKLRRLIDHPDLVGTAKVPLKLIRPALLLYKACVQQLRKVIAAEERGDIHQVDTDIQEWAPAGDGNSLA